MGFSTELQDMFSHEALVGLQDAEIRLLENMKKCVMLRAKCDRDYATSLAFVSVQAQKLEHSKELEGSSIARAWYTLAEETETLSKLIKRNADNLFSLTSEALNSLISEKRALRKLYTDEHDTLHKELTRLQNLVDATKNEYEKLLEMWKDAKSKYEEQYIKGKGGKKLEESKERYLKIAKKLHVSHNDLVLLLCEASEYEKHFRTTLLPGLLYYQQTVMEDAVDTWKRVLSDIYRNIDPTSEQFQAIHTRISKSIEVIEGEDEYKDFICKNRTDPLQPLEFRFDESAMRDFTGSLRPNELVVDDFTHDSLSDRKRELEIKLAKCERELQRNQINLKQYENEIRTSPTMESSSGLKVKKRAVDIIMKEIGQLQCIQHILCMQLQLIKYALSYVSKEGPPPGLDLEDGSVESRDDINIPFTRKSKFIMEKLKQPFFSLKMKHVPTCPPSPPSKDFLESTVWRDNSSHVYKQEIRDTSYQNEDWFHGVLPREEVVRLLADDGDFLVRETVRNDTKQIVLSVCSQGYKHFIVHTTCDGKFRFEGPAFPTVGELIDYQFHSGLPVTLKSGAVLKKSVARERWELNNDDVELVEKIGGGNFGEVYKAKLQNYPDDVAVKLCNVNLPDAQKRKFLQEGRILIGYNHPNIVKLIGICVQKLPIMIVMELVPGGSLLNFLQNKGESLSVQQLLSFCMDAAAGMEYLESKSCIHRDLAARNCLVDQNNLLKISDFGMSRETKEYVVSDGMKQIPIKWTAPEALNYGVYTSLCDVWSYGILMWEIFSLGGAPYLGLSNNKATELVESGYRLHAPDNTPPGVYKLMLRCWGYEPQNRPHFSEILSSLQLAESCDVPFFECSCKEDTNINEIFLTLARKIREQRERRASKFDEMERLQWDKANLNNNLQGNAAAYKCSC